MTEKAIKNSAEGMRVKYGFWVVILGLLVVSIIFIAAIYRWQNTQDVTTAVGVVTGIIGTLVGTFFGIHVGADGKEEIMAEHRNSENTARLLAGNLDPEKFEELKDQL